MKNKITLLFLIGIVVTYGQTVNPGGGGGGSSPSVCPGSSSGTTNAILTDTGAGACRDSLASVAPSTGNFTTPGTAATGLGGTLSGMVSWSPNTSQPTVPANAFSIIQGTTYTQTLGVQPPNAVPTANNVMLFGAPNGSNISSWVFTNAPTLAGTNFTSIPLTSLSNESADTVVMNASGSSAAPTAVAMPTSGTNGCAGTSNALTYNTSTHALGCNSISGGGSGVPQSFQTGNWNTGNIGAAATDYLGIGGLYVGSTTASMKSAPIAINSGTLTTIVAYSLNAPGSGQTYVFTVYKGASGTGSGALFGNLSSTSLTCTISGASAQSCVTTGGSVSYNQGDALYCQVVTSASATAAQQFNCSFQ